MANDNFRLLASMSEGDYKTNIISEYKSKLENKFDQSTSIRTIEEEYPYGSGKFRNLVCRVVSVRTIGTGSKMSDSYKTIIFKTQEYPKSVGYLYRFENNYWIACNSDIMSSATDSLVVRRCNNMLRWKDKNGAIQSVPISFEEEAFYLNNEIKQDIDMNNGYRKAIIQRTDLTKTLEPNQRFIFGEQCLKLSGSGISSFLNQYTEDDDSPSVIRLNLEYDYVNPATDDMTNKIANAYSNEFSIVIDQKATEYAISTEAYTFTATSMKNGYEISQNLAWTVKGGSAYTASQSNNKLNVIFSSAGQYTIEVYSKSNSLLKASIDVTVVSADKYIIQCSPISEVIYKGESETFTFSLYKNGQIVNDTVFGFEKVDNLTSEYYTYTKDGNNKITITNKNMSNTKVNIKCTALNYSDASAYTLSTKLGGGW